MIKTIIPSSFGYQDRLSQLVDVHSRGVDSAWMRKSAAAGIFKDADIKPVKDHSFIHLIAMGDSEYWGFNRNSDGFMKQATTVELPQPKHGQSKFLKIAAGNVETHKTFETHAKVYRNHQNKDPKKAHGDVVKAAHNDVMNRVELIIKVPNATWSSELEKMASGGDVAYSMSCKIPADYCSICGNRARTRREYCEHLKDNLGEITKSGHYTGAINDNMVYFDISQVVVPADRTAFGLLKVAADAHTMGGAELAESMTLFPPETADDYLLGGLKLNKLAMIRKLSEIEKEIEASTDSHSPIHVAASSFDPEVHGDIPDDQLKQLKVPRSQTEDMLGALADVKISLSLKDFMKIVLGDRFNEVADHVDSASNMLPGIFGKMLSEPASTVGCDECNLGDGVIPRHVREVINKMIPEQALDDDSVGRRVTVTVLRGKTPLKMKPVELEKKSSAASVVARRMATAYAMYKVSFCQRVEDDRALIERAILQHYF